MSNSKGYKSFSHFFIVIAVWQYCLVVPGHAASVLTSADASPAKPNVLFIAVDDLRPELGCYGESEIQSPNIDRLASSGVVFNRAYCQLAVCNPSRVSIMTGLRPDSTKVWDLATRFRHTIPDAVTLPQQFMNHGFHAVSYGKVFHNPWPDNQSWSEPHSWPEKSSLWSDTARKRLAEYRKKMQADDRSDRQISRMRAQATEALDIPDHEHVDGAIAEQTLAAMRRLARQNKPFFLAAGFIRPHLPFVVPRKYWDLYKADSIALATNPFLPKDSPSFATNTMYELRDYFDFADTPLPGQGSLTDAQQRRLKHGYYASVSFIDSLIGRLLHALDELGLSDNTIVVLWGDHGWKLGEHNSWCKQSNYEIDTRVPLIIRSPGAAANGQTTDALAELVDVYPTLCELAGLPVSSHLEGRSLTPLLSRPDQSWNKAAFSQFPRKHNQTPLMGYSMRTDSHRYIEWQDRQTRKVVATELYDHRKDPQENSNIASLPENQNRLSELSHQMWTTLPAPPKYMPPTPRRPQITFRNQGTEPLTVFWITPDGEEKKTGVIQAGATMLQNSTLGHRFRVISPGGFTRTFEVTKQIQSFDINPMVQPAAAIKRRRPNIVFCMADDWSWPHAGILGDPVVRTPHFDQIAREGVLFENAFVSTPSCTPSRLSILTGQHHWRLREGDSLGGSIREEYDVYTEMLQKSGYRIGRFGKGVWPSKHTFRKRDSFGERFRSFEEFLEERNSGEPFCYWHGGQDPHRPYELGVGRNSGIDLSKVKVPGCLPDNETVRSDLADYLWEVQRFDREVGSIIERLKAMNELDNTIIVVSGDNGMPFPRCKATLYDQGTRVPLAIRWGAKVKGRRRITDFVSLCDLAPTFLEAAGVKPSKQMTGRSLLPLLESEKSEQVDSARTFVLTGMEKHVYHYPCRALRTRDFLFIRNFHPDEWPTGEVEGQNPTYDFSSQSWPVTKGAFSFNIDPSPSKQFLRLHRTEAETKNFASLAFLRHPTEELYDLRNDPDQLHNVAEAPNYEAICEQLNRQLEAELIRSADPRVAALAETSNVGKDANTAAPAQSHSGEKNSRADVLRQAEDRIRAIYERQEFRAASWSADWTADGTALTRLESRARNQQELARYDAATGHRTVVFSSGQLVPEGKSQPLWVREYELASNGKLILLSATSESQNSIDYWTFHTGKKTLKKIAEQVNSLGNNRRISPDGKHILYRKQRALHVFDLQNNRSTTLLTFPNDIDLRSAVWSPDGTRIAFVQSDHRNVRRRAMLLPTDPTYPEVARHPFALIGTPIPVLRMGVVEVTGGPICWLEIPQEEEGFYVGDLGWTNDSKNVLVKKLSRSRDSREFFLADAQTGKTRRIYHEADPAWVEASYQTNAGLDWLNGGKEFLIVSEKDGWRQAFVFSHEGKEVRCLTPWHSDIIQRGLADETSGWFYFLASPDNATQRYLYRVPLDGSSKPERVTPGKQSGSHDYDFSPNGRWAIHTWSTFDTPPVTELVQLPEHKTVCVFEDNQAIRDRVSPLTPQPTEFFQLEIDDDVTMDAWMIKPRDFDPDKKYPVLVFIYGEPHGQTVLDHWRGGQGHTLFHRTIADIGYLVVSIDNRGTPSPKGAAWRRAVFGSLGPLSTKEQAAGLRELGRTRDYVDMSRIGIWGWSGGGSNTLNAMFRESDLYKVGIAVAPKPQPWLYNAWFQEIYMRTRQSNPEGYRRSAPINFAEGLKGDLLIVHGSGETNTHIQITEGLVDRLVELGKQFDYMVYPNRNHGLREGKGTAVHLRMLMTRYLFDHLPAGPRPRK